MARSSAGHLNMLYLARIVHHLSMAIFIGNIIATLVWKVYAERTGNPSLVCQTLRTAVLTDKTITIPAVLLVTVSGALLMVLKRMSIFGHAWLLWSIALWIVSALAAALYLIPWLARLHTLAEQQQGQERLDNNYYARARQWNTASLLLILSPIAILVLMLVKPLQ